MLTVDRGSEVRIPAKFFMNKAPCLWLVLALSTFVWSVLPRRWRLGTRGRKATPWRVEMTLALHRGFQTLPRRSATPRLMGVTQLMD